MANFHLFTWNLGKNTGSRQEAHKLTVDHLAHLGTQGPFVACLQELPATSSISQARTSPSQDLTARNIAVVSTPEVVRMLALAYRSDLQVVGAPVVDEDREFIAAVFRRPSDPKRIAVVGVHAKSKVDMPLPQDHGGARALLRHAIHALELEYEHLIVLGDFNSPFDSPEIQSWYGFYALSSNKPLKETKYERRRGFAHAPLHVVQPRNKLMGTYAHRDAGVRANLIIDFVAVDEATYPGARAEILTTVAGQTVWDRAEECPSLSDHLPVEGTITV